jgi:acetate CoA/acetoacetate CoA-transferase beta subunit
MVNRERIARKVAQDIQDGDFVNFGHGIPYSVTGFIDPAKKVYFQNECGLVGFGLGPPAKFGQYDFLDTSNSFVSDLPGGAYLPDIAASFAMIRGGHIDKTVLGALQVDEHANIANWRIPGRPASGIGGAMDLCVGCRDVWAAMESITKDGEPRLVKQCSYPLTAFGKVTRVYTEFGVLTVKPGEGFTLIEIFPDYSVETVRSLVEAEIEESKELKMIDIGVPLNEGE